MRFSYTHLTKGLIKIGLFKRRKRQEIRADTSAETRLLTWLDGDDTVLTKKEALEIPTVSACVGKIGETISRLPVKLYRKDGEEVTEIADDCRIPLLNGETGDTLSTVDMWKAVIEDYFLGYDVLINAEPVVPKSVKMSRSIDKEHSYPTNMFHDWSELESFFDEGDQTVLSKLNEIGVPIPEYLETVIKKSDEGKDILMCWPSKDTLICQQDTSNGTLEYFGRKGWHAYRIYEIDYTTIKEELL